MFSAIKSLALSLSLSQPRRVLIVAAVALLLAQSSAAAQQVPLEPMNPTLSSLVAPNVSAYVIVGTDEYSNFVFHASETNGGYLMTPNDITVEPADAPFTGMGIQFQTPAMFVANGQTQDVKLTFDVTELDPMKSITSMELNFDGTTSGNGRASIGEVIADTLNNQLGQGSVVAMQGLQGGGNSTVTPSFAGQNTIQVTKDIALFSGAFAGTDNTAQLSDFQQIVNPNSPPPVPEPSSIGLMLLGSGGLGLIVWRKKQKNS